MNSLNSASEQSSIAEAAASIRADANIGKLLQDAGKLKPQDMERVLKLQQEQNLRFGEAALKLGLVTEADIQQALSLQFEYPYIPAAEASLSPELTAATAPYSKEAEALRSVRSALLLRWFHDGRKTLAIGSARANEGASYLAANLAVLFAQMGRKVLLIDANMRQPRQHDIFNLGNGMGLSDILAERVPGAGAQSPFQT
jgi:chain length determinant protein tyrosine kinase EpsG